MDVAKTIFKVIAGIVFWGYVFLLLFDENTNLPFFGGTDSTSIAQDPAPEQPPKQTLDITGMSVFTSTDTVGRKQQLHFSSPLPKTQAVEHAKRKCQNHIEDTDGSVFCEEVIFFSSGCFVRYLVGNGYTIGIQATQEEAAEDAERQCSAMATDTGYECRRDTNMCINGGDNQGTRNWSRAAVGLTKPFEVQNGQYTTVYIFDGAGDSTQSATDVVAAKCQSKSGKSCNTINTLDGDRCLAIAYTARGAYDMRYGSIEHKAGLKAQAMNACRAASDKPCKVVWKCAGSRIE